MELSMEEVLKEATRLLQDGQPEQALLQLREIEESTQEIEQLKSACKHMLAQQYMYLLREAQKEGDLETAKEIARKYRQHIGEDERISQLLEETESKHEEKKTELAIVEQQQKETKKQERKEGFKNFVQTNILPIGIGIVALTFLISLLAFRHPYLELKKDLQLAHDALTEKEEENKYVQRDLTAKIKTLSGLRETFVEETKRVEGKVPLLITDIKMGNTYKNGNVETDFGNTIYSSSSMYLTPQITAYGFKDEVIELKIKLYSMNGMLRRGDSSPQGCSYTTKVQCTKNALSTQCLTGWGNENKGHWNSDTYRIEIWYKDICLKKHNFTIH